MHRFVSLSSSVLASTHWLSRSAVPDSEIVHFPFHDSSVDAPFPVLTPVIILGPLTLLVLALTVLNPRESIQGTDPHHTHALIRFSELLTSPASLDFMLYTSHS